VRDRENRTESIVAPSSLLLAAEMWVCSGGNAALGLNRRLLLRDGDTMRVHSRLVRRGAGAEVD
jgi:hypothetical protein